MLLKARESGRNQGKRVGSRKVIVLCDHEGSTLTPGKAKSSLVLTPSWVKSQREFSHTLWVDLFLMHGEGLIPACSLGTLGEHPALEVAVGQQDMGQWSRAVCPHQPGEGQDSTWHLPHIWRSLTQRCHHCQDHLHWIHTSLYHCFAFYSPLILRCKLIYGPNYSLSDLWKFNLFPFQSSILKLQDLLSICQKVSLLLGASGQGGIVKPINKGNFVDLHFFSFSFLSMPLCVRLQLCYVFARKKAADWHCSPGKEVGNKGGKGLKTKIVFVP